MGYLKSQCSQYLIASFPDLPIYNPSFVHFSTTRLRLYKSCNTLANAYSATPKKNDKTRSMNISYQTIFVAPFGLLGIRCDDAALSAIEFLGSGAAAVAHTPLAREVCKQLAAYFSDPAFQFNLPLHLTGTPHQTKVWQVIRDIPVGRTRQYGELATLLYSSARAVGGTCGTNPIPIVIPCHRVVGKSGLGGFMQQRKGSALDIKRWLLNHEQRSNRPHE